MSLNETIFQFCDNQGEMVFPINKVKIKIYDKELIHNIHFIKSNLVFEDDVIAQSKFKANGIVLGFNMLGDITYKSKTNNYRFNTYKNRTDIELIKEENKETKVKKGEVNKISLVIKKDFLHKNLPKNKKTDYILNALEKNNCQELLKSKDTNFFTTKILAQLYNFDLYSGNLGDIFIQSKVLELLYSELIELSKDSKEIINNNIKFNEQDKESLYKAKELILSLKEDLTISSLSKKVRLNEFKLKYGFKQLFNTTIGQMILEQKMLYAKQLLETSEFSISEISSFVGYKHQQNFSTAFIQFFGIRPKDLMKSRNYYY